uniref:Mitochondrial carrier protein n=1 Tax=Haptolina ericina TaxID=156174 RepID=A0A7S3FBI5_9EUKA
MNIVRLEGFGALYVGLCPIAMRQLPYTVTKLVAYEMLARVTTQAARRIEMTISPDSSGEALRPYAIVLAGLVAGAAAAVLSHPADLMLTRLCGAATANVATSAAECVIAEGFVEQVRYLMGLGMSGAFAGLAPRLVMTSAMTSIQFVIYDNVRRALGVSGTAPPPTAVVIPAG